MNVRTVDWADRLRPSREAVLWAALIINFELLLLGSYAIISNAQLVSPSSIRYYLYPFVWINVSIWAIVRTTPTPTGTRQPRIAAAIAVGYFAVLAYAGGLVGPASTASLSTFRVVLFELPPGWSPAVIYDGTILGVTLLPYKLIGYAALSYLVFATVIDAAGSAVTGLLGLLSCVSCTWPVLATITTGVLGSGTAVAGAVYTQSYGLSTAVFVVTVALLYWRPFGR